MKKLLVLLLAACALAARLHASELLERRGMRPIQLAVADPVQLFRAEDSVHGLRLSLFYGRNFDVRWADIGLVNRADGNAAGLRLGVVNSAGQNVGGISLGLWNDVGIDQAGLSAGGFNVTGFHAAGLQVGLVNWSDTATGCQIGVLNHSWETTGLQVGVLNVAGHLQGVQIGVLNIITERHAWRVLPILNAAW
jgi:hypothetical protein